jgi:hypothetical protein
MIGAMSLENVGFSAAFATAHPLRRTAIGQLTNRRNDQNTP